MIVIGPAGTFQAPKQEQSLVMWPSTEFIEKRHTKQLLNDLRETNCYGGWDTTALEWDQLKAYRERIKAVLATREHVPNKKESKEARIARKKSGKPRSKAKR